MVYTASGRVSAHKLKVCLLERLVVDLISSFAEGMVQTKSRFVRRQLRTSCHDQLLALKKPSKSYLGT